MKNKQKGFTWEREVGSFRIRVTEERVDIETFGREIKWVFLLGTKQYLHFKYYFESGHWKTIEYLVKTMYNTLLVFSDAQLVVDINKLISDSLPRIQERIAKAQSDTEETEEEILKQEKLKNTANERQGKEI